MTQRSLSKQESNLRMNIRDQLYLYAGLTMAEYAGRDVIVHIKGRMQNGRLIEYTNMLNTVQGKLAQVAVAIYGSQQVADGMPRYQACRMKAKLFEFALAPTLISH